MCGNGVMTVMEVTAVPLRRIRRARATAPSACTVAVDGIAMLGAVVSPAVIATPQAIVATALVFVSVIEFFLQDTLNP